MNSANEQQDTASLRGAGNCQKLSIRVENPEVDREDPDLELAIAYVHPYEECPLSLGKEQKLVCTRGLEPLLRRMERCSRKEQKLWFCKESSHLSPSLASSASGSLH